MCLNAISETLKNNLSGTNHPTTLKFPKNTYFFYILMFYAMFCCLMIDRLNNNNKCDY